MGLGLYGTVDERAEIIISVVGNPVFPVPRQVEKPRLQTNRPEVRLSIYHAEGRYRFGDPQSPRLQVGVGLANKAMRDGIQGKKGRNILEGRHTCECPVMPALLQEQPWCRQYAQR